MTVEEFEISQYIDPQLDKYFKALRSRTHYAIDSFIRPDLRYASHKVSSYTTDTCFIYGRRDFGGKHLPYATNCLTYRWNVIEDIDINFMIANGGFNTRHGKVSDSSQVYIKFNTGYEKKNFTKFIYSVDGFRFMSKVFTALNTDGNYAANIAFPKVDWTRAWTVEEILEDYGYTETEIAEVIADLENFKDMERD
jgi:hypothetical protein